MEVVELKGFRSHWIWTGLTYKMCATCKYLDDRPYVPEFCPGCKAVMIQPEPTRGGTRLGELFDNGGYDSGLVMNTIDNAPTVEINTNDIQYAYDQGFKSGYELGKEERPQGEWVKQEWGYICSVCKETNDYAYDDSQKRFVDKFCPNCGADMRGDHHED